MKNWIYNEFKHCGVNYAEAVQAEVYDERHNKFRDFEGEFKGMLEFLSLNDTEKLSMVDLGCGTGTLEVYAASVFKKIYGVDVSDVMIGQAKKKLEQANIHNVEFIQAGFLSYQHQGDPVDLVVTKMAFHHLPDFWKQIALLNINQMLKNKGLLYIYDVIYSFDASDYQIQTEEWLAGFAKQAGMQMAEEVATHIREEYSTFGWILEGLLERAGFEVERVRNKDGFIAEFCCYKVKEVG